MKKNQASSRRDILEAGRKLYERGFVASNDGNVSMRLGANRILITPTGISKGSMKPDDLSIIDMTGKVVSGRKKPSSEFQLHLCIYREREDVNGICHAHPPYATGFAVAGVALDQSVLPEVVVALGSVPLVPYGTTGTDELHRALLPFVRDYDAFLLANHGALTVGSDVLSAYYKMETLEHCARIMFVARMLGNVNLLDEEQVGKLASVREKFGIRPDIGKAR